jgi:hypothetical protein
MTQIAKQEAAAAGKQEVKPPSKGALELLLQSIKSK